MNVSANYSNSTALMSSLASDIAEALDLYLAPFLIFTGGVCNVLVILVMRASFFAHVSTSMYMSFNALVDGISLTVVLPVHWLHVNYPETIYRGDHSYIICDILNFIGWSTSDMGIVLTVAMTFERAFAVKFPLKAASFCTRRKAKFIVAGLTVLVCAKDGHFLIKSQMVDINVTSHLCELESSNPDFYQYGEKVWPIFHNVFVFVSFGVIIASNIIIIKNVRETNSFSFKATSFRKVTRRKGLASRRSSTSRSRQLTIMLISDSLTIIVCTLPFALLDAIHPHISFQNAGVEHLVFSICFNLLYVNRCANFFLYCVSGERFRLGLKQICAKTRLRRTSYYSTSPSDRRKSEPAVGVRKSSTNGISTIS